MDHPPIDEAEKRIRFGCGFVAGVVIAASILLPMVWDHAGAIWAVIVAVGIVCGLCALRYGDDFWTRLIDWTKWWS